jgi:beta-lactamase superfamily II metal-dependent hydrolase
MGSFGDNKINIVDQLQIEGIGDLSQLDAVIISHVHNDHLGNIIQLIKA